MPPAHTFSHIWVYGIEKPLSGRDTSSTENPVFSPAQSKGL